MVNERAIKANNEIIRCIRIQKQNQTHIQNIRMPNNLVYVYMYECVCVLVYVCMDVRRMQKKTSIATLLIHLYIYLLVCMPHSLAHKCVEWNLKWSRILDWKICEVNIHITHVG